MLPEIRISLYIGFIVSLFLIKDLTAYLVIFVAVTAFLFRLPFRSVKKGWIPVLALLVFTFLGNALFERGKILLSLGPVILTEEGLATAFLRTIRVFLMVAGAKILTATTGTELLMRGVGRMLKPLGRLGVPVGVFLSTMDLTMKSLPGLREQIMRTYEDKMHDGGVRGFRGRIKVISFLVMPFFVKSMRSPEVFFEDGRQTGEK